MNIDIEAIIFIVVAVIACLLWAVIAKLKKINDLHSLVALAIIIVLFFSCRILYFVITKQSTIEIIYNCLLLLIFLGSPIYEIIKIKRNKQEDEQSEDGSEP